MLKYIFPQRTEEEKKKKRKETQEKNGSSKFTVIYASFYLWTDWILKKPLKLTLLQALFSQDCNSLCKLLYSTILKGKKPSLWQWSFVSEFLSNLCLQATCLCRGGKKKIHHSENPNSTVGTVITELCKLTVPQAFQSTRSLTTLVKCICMKNIINSSVTSFLTRGSIPQRIS